MLLSQPIGIRLCLASHSRGKEILPFFFDLMKHIATQIYYISKFSLELDYDELIPHTGENRRDVMVPIPGRQ